MILHGQWIYVREGTHRQGEYVRYAGREKGHYVGFYEGDVVSQTSDVSAGWLPDRFSRMADQPPLAIGDFENVPCVRGDRKPVKFVGRAVKD